MNSGWINGPQIRGWSLKDDWYWGKIGSEMERRKVVVRESGVFGIKL